MNLLIASSVTCTMLILRACAGLPTESQTGRTAIVRVLDGEVLLRNITVQPGDAVELLQCSRSTGLDLFRTGSTQGTLLSARVFFLLGVEEVAKVRPGESAGVCFSSPGEYGYWVQSEPSVQGGARVGELDMPASLPAAVVVEGIRRPSLDR